LGGESEQTQTIYSKFMGCKEEQSRRTLTLKLEKMRKLNMVYGHLLDPWATFHYGQPRAEVRPSTRTRRA
jgi:hypothetical protein